MPGRIGDWLQAEAEVVGHDENMAQVRARLYGPRHDTLTGAGLVRAAEPPSHAEEPELSVTEDNPPEGFLRIDFDRGRPPNPTFNAMSATSM